MSEIIRIIFTDEDVRAMAKDAGVSEWTALARAESWGKHIQDTAMTLCSEQLADVIALDQP